MEEVEVVAFACRGTLIHWAEAIDAVAYELARRNGESPLDRGAALGRRAELLGGGDLASGLERLTEERGYVGEESGDELLARVVASARPRPGARDAVSLAVRSGKRVIAVARNGGGACALQAFGEAFEAVVPDPRDIGVPLGAIMYVSAAEWRREEARRRGMRVAAPEELGSALAIPAAATAILAV
jgi:hypothetical protein